MSSDLQSSPSMGTMIVNGVTKLVYRVGSLVFGLSTLLGVFLYFKQDSMLYFPEISGLPRRPSQNPRRYRSPEEHQVPFENLQIKCRDGVSIHAWLLLRSRQKNDLPTLVFFHGNAGNIGLRLPNALQMFQNLNANVFMVEYRGYGDSDSVTPNEQGLKLDGKAALDFIIKHPKIDPTKIFLFGRSLGGAVAIDLANYAEETGIQLAGVMVENTFTSIAAMVDHLMPFLAPFKFLVLRIGWNSAQIVPKLNVPILYLAGLRDELVPHSHMLDLFNASKLGKLHVIPNGTHNETWVKGGPRYWDAIKAFMAEAMNKAPPLTVASTNTESVANSIPIMPTGLMGITREAVRESSAALDQTAGKKEL